MAIFVAKTLLLAPGQAKNAHACLSAGQISMDRLAKPRDLARFARNPNI
jgi:hypothetical protein